MFPSSSVELNTLFKQTYNNGKVNYFRVPKISHDYEFDAGTLKAGVGIKVKDGRDATIVVTGPQLKNVLGAAERLGQEGVDVEIIYIHTIKPLDRTLVFESVAKTKKVLIVEEHSMFGGLGDEVVRVTKEISGVTYATIAIPDEFIRGYGTYEELGEPLGFSIDGIYRKVKEGL